MKLFSTIAAGFAATILLGACGDHVSHGDHHDGEGIVVSSAYVMPPFPGKSVGAGFFEITNHGADDRLIAVSSDASSTVEIHTHLNEDGVMKMVKLDGLDLPHGETITFKPGSYHLMMFDAAMTQEDEDVALTFTYQTAAPVTLIVPVGEPKETDHSGH